MQAGYNGWKLNEIKFDDIRLVYFAGVCVCVCLCTCVFPFFTPRSIGAYCDHASKRCAGFPTPPHPTLRNSGPPTQENSTEKTQDRSENIHSPPEKIQDPILPTTWTFPKHVQRKFCTRTSESQSRASALQKGPWKKYPTQKWFSGSFEPLSSSPLQDETEQDLAMFVTVNISFGLCSRGPDVFV